jgi:DNA-binding GntR family transcriptional regulator
MSTFDNRHSGGLVLNPKQTYKDIVIRHIYDGLMDGKYEPGEKVLESALSHELGLSRAPVREALRELVSNGLLEYRPQVGNFIASLSPEEIIDSYVARGVLEGYAVAQGVDNFTEAELDTLEKMAHKMEQLAEKNQRKALIGLGQEFHRELFSHCTNNQVVHFTEQLSLKLHFLFYKHWAKVYTPGEIRDRHLEIISTIRKGDSVELEMKIRNHYIETGRKIIQQVSDSRSTREINPKINLKAREAKY